jgi:D-sedoheptulose 7-phosphate isomerase
MTDSLAELYPFLHGRKQDASSMTAALLESVQQKAADGIRVKEQFFAEHGAAVVQAAQAIAQVYSTAA